MALTLAGRDFIAGAIVGAASPVFDNTNAYIGVGDGTAPFDATQTGLQGVNKFRAGMDISYPLVAGNVITFKSTFGPNDANFAWQEWGVFNASTGGIMLNRVVEYNGTKLNGQTWVLEVEITLNIAP